MRHPGLYSNTTYDEAQYYRDHALSHREACRAANVCICGPKHGGVSRNGIQHGPPVKAGRCQRCWDVKRRAA